MTQAANLGALGTNANSSGVTQVAGGGTGLTAPGTAGNVLTSNGSAWTSAAAGGIGVGQTWQNVTGSRSSGVTYTNSTGKPIAVSAYSASSAYSGISMYVAGNLIAVSENGYHPGGTGKSLVFAVVPDGTTYRVDSFGTFWELR